jgi:hypothetical protein
VLRIATTRPDKGVVRFGRDSGFLARRNGNDIGPLISGMRLLQEIGTGLFV